VPLPVLWAVLRLRHLPGCVLHFVDCPACDFLCFINQHFARFADVLVFESRGRQRQSYCCSGSYCDRTRHEWVFAQELSETVADFACAFSCSRAEITQRLSRTICQVAGAFFDLIQSVASRARVSRLTQLTATAEVLMPRA
jgi:hypothetical protein